MSKYGWYGGYKRVRNEPMLRDVESSEYQEQRRLRRQLEAKKKSYNQKFGGPVFSAAKKLPWWNFPINEKFFVVLIGCVPVGFVYWSWQRHLPTTESAQATYERDVLVRKAFQIHGDKWYARFLPYHGRWKEIQKEDKLRNGER